MSELPPIDSGPKPAGSGITAVASWLVVLIAVCVLGWLWFGPEEEEPDERPPEIAAGTRAYLRDARDAMLEGKYLEARELAKSILKDDGELVEALMIAGRACEKIGENDEALRFLRRVPKNKSMDSIDAGFSIGRIEFEHGSYDGAESALRDVLKRRPTHLDANDLLAELLNVQGRRWESLPLAIEVARQGQATLEPLLLLADQSYVLIRTARAESALERSPQEVAPVLGLARADFEEGRTAEGLKRLRQVVTGNPRLVEAQILWGQHLLDSNESEFAEWHRKLGSQADSHPGLWLLRGTWARRKGQNGQATRCYWEALRRNPNDLKAHVQLSQLLTVLDRAGDAKPFADRAAQLVLLKKALEPVIARGSAAKPDDLRAVAIVLEALGRGLEARNWELEALDAEGGNTAFEPERQPAENTRQMLALWVRPDLNPALFLDLSDLPLPEIQATQTSSTSGDENPRYFARFADRAADTGFEFQYVAAPDDATEGKRVIELTGGGAAAIDFDLDNRPDVFLTQGGYFPLTEGPDAPADALFRNLGGAFENVANLAGVAGTEFGQGMAVGDYNTDGFPDLFVANLGENQLYANNGDGTFTDVTPTLNDTSSDWSTSAMMADLDGDGLPEIYVANYLEGPELHTLICQTTPDAPPRICTPDMFEGAQDRLFRNSGDGSFADVTDGSGIVRPQGKALGLLGADFSGTGRLQIFVANDGVPNFFYVSEAGSLKFVESAEASGVSVSGDGRAQACMGVASGDANLDGRLDFFVTNFDRESNTLYSSLGDGMFDDASRQYGVREPSYRLLGFGTQFIDGDLDGDLDLVLTNGHVDDFTHSESGAAYRMRAQYLSNDGRGNYRESLSDQVGDCFAKEQLGRGLCRIDWNRDGRDDVVISHLDTPASLLTNVSTATGNQLSVRLVGTDTNRDAIGTTVRIVDGDWRRMQQLVAGDGYQCSNERVLRFGLGSREVVPELEVTWPDGSKQKFEHVDVGIEVVIIQGRGLFSSID